MTRNPNLFIAAAASLLLCGVAAVATAGDDKKDKASQLLENLLRPAGVGKASNISKPQTLAGPSNIEDPMVPLAKFQGDPPKPKPEFPGKVVPRPLAEDLPFLKKKV